MASSSTDPSSLPPIQTQLSSDIKPKRNSAVGSRGSLSNSDFLANLPPPQHPSSNRASLTKTREMASPATGPVSVNNRSSNRNSSATANNWAATVAATKGPLPSVIFAIPFPEPGPTLRKTSKTPMFMLYTPPRANYVKPKQINGKKEKEGLIKKVERKWQEEVKEGMDVKAGKVEDPSSWKKFKGTILTAASKALNWLPDSNIQTIGRLPPGKKIGLITIVYPHEDDDLTPKPVDRQPQDVKEGLESLLKRTRRKAMLKTGISGLFLPVTAAIDVFCVVPLFIFEINIVYFSLQINGARKIAMLTHANSKAKKHSVKKAVGTKSGRFVKLKQKITRRGRKQQSEVEAEAEAEPHPASPPLPNEPVPGEIFNIQKSRPNVFQPVMANLYALCSATNPVAFPPKPKGSLVPPYRPDLPLVVDLIAAFKDWVPADVALRHNLDPQVVAKDLRQSMKKATKSYMRSLKSVK
ncbi:hypothetical protein PCASD_02554 [Puccinia coronata f. sp. avenae]|uniref:Uncharacterized protein n=1 Tax=Puccinia coronata f. sp. avenae TaxID=200324 RepID=A0A2N5TE41_9BASI|nr:hypothetical protein PCASD_08722 [Puccinia coronata f. sp. avenae]PLW47356.1 hypothetical protein PCASD_02554 [Puccinia coronata f. sp. avenae]